MDIYQKWWVSVLNITVLNSYLMTKPVLWFGGPIAVLLLIVVVGFIIQSATAHSTVHAPVWTEKCKQAKKEPPMINKYRVCAYCIVNIT